MRVHLYTTDASALELLRFGLGIQVTAVIFPENRAKSEKIARLAALADRRLFQHRRGHDTDSDLPAADAAIVWMYSQIFPASLIQRYKLGMLNMHGGKIPQYRGASVLQWAIINGESTLGITWHQIVDDVDAGPIWEECEIQIAKDETAWSLRNRMIAAGISLFPRAWSAMISDAPPVRIPDLSSGKIWPQRNDADGRIRPGMTERQVRDLIRALCHPWPRATIETDHGLSRVKGILCSKTTDCTTYITAEGRELFFQLESFT